MITDTKKAMNKDGRVAVPLPHAGNPEHVGRVLGDIAKKIGGLAPSRLRERADAESPGIHRVDPSVRRDLAREARGRSGGPRPAQYGGSSSSAPDPLGLFS